MQLITSTIRKVNGRELWRVTIVYVRKDGMKITSAPLKDSRKEAENFLKWRLAGLNNGGAHKATA